LASSPRRRRRAPASSTETEPAAPPLPVWSTACPDWERRIVEGRSLIPFAPLFPAEAEAALAVFRELHVVDVGGTPTFGEIARPWILDFVAAIFGAYDHAIGRRLIRNFLLSISKKNGKSTLAAGIMLTALIRNWRLSGEFIILAPTIEVAQNSFKPARDMISSSEELSDILHPQPSIRTITHLSTGATLKVVAADSQTVSGKKAIGVLVDELWQFGLMADAENMLREATGGLASRPEGFVIYLTTQSDAPPAGIFNKTLKYFRDVRDGVIEDRRSLPVLYEFPEPMLKAKTYRELANWYVTNPNLGASVDVEFLQERFRIDQASGEDSLRGFFAKHLNVEIGLALRSDRWAGADHWEKNAEPGLTLERLIELCEVANVGIDGGGLDDLLGLAVIGRVRGTADNDETGADNGAGPSPAPSGLVAKGQWLLWTHAWCHRSVLALRTDIAAQLKDYEADGDLTIVDRVGDDVIAVVDIVARLRDAGLLPDKGAIGVDPAGIGEIVEALGERDFDATPEAQVIVGIPQGWKLMGAIKTLERKLAGAMLRHAGTRLMAWCVGNAKVVPNGNAISITKQASGKAKIDPLMATFDAAALMAMNPQTGGIGEGIILLDSA
jgi:phage terminase large subunit-like protein